MAIVKPPVRATQKSPEKDAEIDAFITGAPDAPAAPRRVRKGKKLQISLTISEEMLARVDAKAAQIGQSRAAVINLAIAQVLESGISLGGAD